MAAINTVYGMLQSVIYYVIHTFDEKYHKRASASIST
jgi:hypothetical protein